MPRGYFFAFKRSPGGRPCLVGCTLRATGIEAGTQPLFLRQVIADSPAFRVALIFLFIFTLKINNIMRKRFEFSKENVGSAFCIAQSIADAIFFVKRDFGLTFTHEDVVDERELMYKKNLKDRDVVRYFREPYVYNEDGKFLSNAFTGYKVDFSNIDEDNLEFVCHWKTAVLSYAMGLTTGRIKSTV